jgi:hypothetical protein
MLLYLPSGGATQLANIKTITAVFIPGNNSIGTVDYRHFTRGDAYRLVSVVAQFGVAPRVDKRTVAAGEPMLSTATGRVAHAEGMSARLAACLRPE